MARLSRKERLKQALEPPPPDPVEHPKPPQAAAQFDVRVPVSGADEDLLAALRQPFIGWFDARINLDARCLALRQPPRWSTGVNALHRDCGGWMVEHTQTVPPSHPEFVALLQEAGCSLRTIGGDLFADYVGLKEDIAAHELFQRSPLPDPGKPGGAARERMPVPIPAPATTLTTPDGTPLPPGCRIISWQPREAPVRLTNSTVTDVPKFADATLRELGNELQGKHWLGGGWGGIPALLDRPKGDWHSHHGR